MSLPVPKHAPLPEPPSHAQKLEADSLKSYLGHILAKGKGVFYSDFLGQSHFAKFTAKLEKPRTINNFAGGHPADYRLVLESDTQTPRIGYSYHSGAGHEFEQWCKEIARQLDRYPFEFGLLDANSFMSRITMDFKTDHPAIIAALDDLCVRDQKQGLTR